MSYINTWLVQSHGMEGAAIATLVTEVWIVVAAFLALVRAQKLGPTESLAETSL